MVMTRNLRAVENMMENAAASSFSSLAWEGAEGEGRELKL